MKFLFKLNQPCLVGNFYDRYQKNQFCIQLHVDILKIIPYLQANLYQPETKVLIPL